MKTACVEVSLNGQWQLHEEAISVLADQGPRISELADGWIPQPVPGDVRQGLIAAGRVSEPLEGLNSNSQYWVEDRSWWFRRKFDVSKQVLTAHTLELELDGLDANASIFLNGRHLGDHPSAFRPFVAKVSGLLKAGENVLLVRLTHGVENIHPEDYLPLKGWQVTDAARGHPERMDLRRIFARKPQFSWGWDWAPRVATIAIAGGVKLRAMTAAVIRDVQVVACAPVAKELAAGKLKSAQLTVTATVQWLDPFKSGRGTVKVSIADEAGKVVASCQREQMLQSGLNYIDMPVTIKNPKLWWPLGMLPGNSPDARDARASAKSTGAAKSQAIKSANPQHRYTVKVELVAGDRKMTYPLLKYGVRFIELLVEGTFAFRVNGRVMFAKGANWVPADSLYARVSSEKYDTLVREAAGANFNMLRIWGGGLYEPEAFYEACDREGILVWHDFMLACAPYPDHLDWFRDELAREADYQTRRLRNHCCMALWCGSNEVLYCLGSELRGNLTDKATRLLGEVFPAAVRKNCPQIPYWYTSPSGGEKPDSWEVGDCHFWTVPMQPDLDKRFEPSQMDTCDALFVSEFGYPGPCGKESTLQYLAGAGGYDRTPGGAWVHHHNTFDFQGGLDAGCRKHYADPLASSLDEYLYFGGLTQGLMYAYALDSLRSKPHCHGALFWMYSDCWGEIGWTIIDYYLRPKASYWFVKRAFAPKRLILRKQGEKVTVTLSNDTLADMRGEVEFGYVSLDGAAWHVKRKKFAAKATARTVVASFAIGEHDATKGLWFARIVGTAGDILPATLHATEFRKLQIVKPTLQCQVTPLGKGVFALTISSDVYAHAIELQLPPGSQAGENYFDLLPGESRTVRVSAGAKLTAKNIKLASAWDYLHAHR